MGRRFRRYPGWSVWICGALLLFLGGRLLWDRLWAGVPNKPSRPRSVLASGLAGAPIRGPCRVVRIVRGDLIIVRQSIPIPDNPARRIDLEVPVQLLAIRPAEDAESQRAAAEFSSNFLEAEEVRLDLDRRRVDPSGHFLAYVYVGESLLNEELLRAGLARLDVYPGDSQSILRNLKKAEGEAKRAGRGIWNK